MDGFLKMQSTKNMLTTKIQIDEKEIFDIIILGGGPAGLTAGIYSARAMKKTLILNEGTIGGQLAVSYLIANYPGVENISGFQLGKIMKNQAKSFGCVIKSNITISKIDFSANIKTVELNDGTIYESNAVILAPGGKARTLNVPGEEDFKGKGISYCATCDGDFFQDKDIIVVGGGNSALEEAVSLTQFASSVTIVHEFDHFQASNIAIIEAKENKKINFILESTISEFFGDISLKKVNIKNLKTGIISEKKIDGVFTFIGYVPNTESFKNKIRLLKSGEIIVDEKYQTNIKGVFAAGDCIPKHFRQITTSVADGTNAAIFATEFLNTL